MGRLVFLSSFIFFIGVQLCIAQHVEKRDSLLTVLKASKEDTNKVNVLLLLGTQFERNIPESAIYYYKQAGALSEKINYPLGTLKYIANVVEELDQQSKYEEGLALNLKSIEIAKKLNLPKRLAAAYSNTGVSYYYMADYQNCTNSFIKAASILEKQPLNLKSDQKDLAGLYANLTGILSEANQNDLAYEYGLKSMAMCKLLKDSVVMARTLNNLGSVLYNKNKLDSALVCLNQAKIIANKTGNKVSEESAYITLCNIYRKLGKYDLVLASAEKGLILSQELEDSDGISKALIFKADYYLNHKDYAIAKQFAEQGLLIAQKNKLNNHIGEEYLMLSDIELAMGNMDAYHRLRNLSDSMNYNRQNQKSKKIKTNSPHFEL